MFFAGYIETIRYMKIYFSHVGFDTLRYSTNGGWLLDN
jgi:hypothetical protein